ncbi:hypothetical protein chiPu_0006314 [Chiloscyllium punctatum]|uniref:Uncharacterized protein n=1 Tax=Chiloscyllium punctatum TaxID=137246 RepID=A0A401SBW6_CHIPU|nr:hypothetical protein [Chiloscyllium punctatum]
MRSKHRKHHGQIYTAHAVSLQNRDKDHFRVCSQRSSAERGLQAMTTSDRLGVAAERGCLLGGGGARRGPAASAVARRCGSWAVWDINKNIEKGRGKKPEYNSCGERKKIIKRFFVLTRLELNTLLL